MLMDLEAEEMTRRQPVLMVIGGGVGRCLGGKGGMKIRPTLYLQRRYVERMSRRRAEETREI